MHRRSQIGRLYRFSHNLNHVAQRCRCRPPVSRPLWHSSPPFPRACHVWAPHPTSSVADRRRFLSVRRLPLRWLERTLEIWLSLCRFRVSNSVSRHHLLAYLVTRIVAPLWWTSSALPEYRIVSPVWVLTLSLPNTNHLHSLTTIIKNWVIV